MTQKTISLPEDVYDKLKQKKRENETFTQLINRLMSDDTNQEENIPFEAFIGVFKDDNEWDAIEQQLRDVREIPRVVRNFDRK